MIDNPNPNNYYDAEQMAGRQDFIPQLDTIIFNLREKIETEEPFPEKNMDLDDLGEIDDALEIILNNWYY